MHAGYDLISAHQSENQCLGQPYVGQLSQELVLL